MTSSEFDEYVELSRQISYEFAKFKSKRDEDQPNVPPRLERLLMDRAEIIKKAEDKPRAYQQIIGSKPPKPYLVFADDNEQVDALMIAHKNQISEMNRNSEEIMKDDILIFSGESDEWQRKKILEEAKKRKTPIMAMYCLDEGIDVPEFQSAILVSSSSSQRQYIQRRGRILRAGEKGKIANLYDIIVLPRSGDYDEIQSLVATEVIKKERNRIEELSRDALNKNDAILKFEKEIEHLGFGLII